MGNSMGRIGMDAAESSNHTIGDRLAFQAARLRRRIAGRMEQGFYSEFRGYGLRRDLSRPFEIPRAKIPFYIRPLKAEDLDTLLPLTGGLEASERQQIAWRRHFHKKMPKGCIVAVDARSDRPCFMEWLLSSRDNPGLARFKHFPALKRNEALLEQAYTIPSHRGMGIMSAAMAEIAALATGLGAEHVLTFVSEEGKASLKACQRAGFEPYLLHRRIQIAYGTLVHNRFEKINSPSLI
jgi:RimJ/RimL family protein N-acetyltransferase